MGRPAGWMVTLTGRPAMRSPGRPPPRRDVERAFWLKIAEGLTSEDAAIACGVSGPVGSRWFRERGGMPSIQLTAPCGRYLSFAEREEIALAKAKGLGVRSVGSRVGPLAVNDLAGAATERGDAWWPTRVPGVDRAVEGGAAGASPEDCEVGRQRSAARLRAGSPGRRDPHRRRDTGGRAGHDLEGPQQASASGPAVGDIVEPGTDRQPVADRLPR